MEGVFLRSILTFCTTLSYFGRYVKKHLGVTPTQYREAGSPKMG